MLTPEQREARRQGIGGSDAAALLGLSKWQTPLSVYLEKIGEGDDEDLSANDCIHFGNILEPIVADEYARRTGKEVFIEPDALIHPQYDWMRANIDRRIKGEDAVLECKTAGTFVKDQWGEEASDNIPDAYLMQCAHYAAVCDVSRVDIAVLIGGQEFRIYTYQRNKALEEKLIERERHFWHEHVLKRVPPPPANPAEAMQLWPREKVETSIAAPEILETIATLRNTKQQIKVLQGKVGELQTKIVSQMQEAGMLIDSAGHKLATWKAQKANRFDSTTFKQKEPELYQQYVKTSQHRVLRLASL